MARTKLKGSGIKVIPLVKAFAIVKCLQHATRIIRNIARYFPLVAKKLGLCEAAIRHVWLHRNWVQDEWNEVSSDDKYNQRKYWIWLFLYGQKNKIDYELARNVAASHQRSGKTGINDYYGFTIDDTLNVKKVLPKLKTMRLRDLMKELQDFLLYYEEQINKAEKLDVKVTNKVEQRAIEMGSKDLQERVYMKLHLFIKGFFIPPNLITLAARQILDEPNITVKWKKYLSSYVKSKKFEEIFRKKHNLAARSNETLPNFPADCILKRAIVKLVKLGEYECCRSNSEQNPEEQISVNITSIKEEQDECTNTYEPANLVPLAPAMEDSSTTSPSWWRSQRSGRLLNGNSSYNQITHEHLSPVPVPSLQLCQLKAENTENSFMDNVKMTEVKLETPSTASMLIKSDHSSGLGYQDAFLETSLQDSMNWKLEIVQEDDRMNEVSDLITLSEEKDIIRSITEDICIEPVCLSFLKKESVFQQNGRDDYNNNSVSRYRNTDIDSIEFHDSWIEIIENLELLLD